MDQSRALPTGVVTFLLTDVEGSTRLWEREPEAMRHALGRHDAVVSACVRRQNGNVVKSKGEGDSVFAVFRHVRDAVTAALVIQCALGLERWATSTPIRVRMAIHTGQIELRDGDYYGPTVNRCARLRALARGGQVLLSGVTAQLTQGQLPAGGSLKDLGTQSLKDLNAPERVWQLLHPQMSAPATAAAQARVIVPTAPSRRAYVLTDHLNRTEDGREWGAGVKHMAMGLAEADADGRLTCYTTPLVAGFLNAVTERFRIPRLWEATIDRDPTPGDATVACREVKTIKQVPLPSLTGQLHARFAVLCARAACDNGQYGTDFSDWADGWLNGQDSSGVNARELADTFEAEAHRGTGMAHPVLVMSGTAARAAAHASKLGWLVGRARDSENARAIELSAEAIRTAVRMARLDLVALSEEAAPGLGGAPLAPSRHTESHSAGRILTALPT